MSVQIKPGVKISMSQTELSRDSSVEAGSLMSAQIPRNINATVNPLSVMACQDGWVICRVRSVSAVRGSIYIRIAEMKLRFHEISYIECTRNQRDKDQIGYILHYCCHTMFQCSWQQEEATAKIRRGFTSQNREIEITSVHAKVYFSRQRSGQIHWVKISDTAVILRSLHWYYSSN